MDNDLSQRPTEPIQVLSEKAWQGAVDIATLPFVWDQIPDYQKQDIGIQTLTSAAFGGGTSALVRGAKPVAGVPSPLSLNRPYKRKDFRELVEGAAPRTPDGRFIDPNTNLPIDGKFHYGHKYGYEHRRLLKEAQERGMSQKEFNDWINSHPEWFQIDDPWSNWSHQFEKPGNE